MSDVKTGRLINQRVLLLKNHWQVLRWGLPHIEDETPAEQFNNLFRKTAQRPRSIEVKPTSRSPQGFVLELRRAEGAHNYSCVPSEEGRYLGGVHCKLVLGLWSILRPRAFLVGVLVFLLSLVSLLFSFPLSFFFFVSLQRISYFLIPYFFRTSVLLLPPFLSSPPLH